MLDDCMRQTRGACAQLVRGRLPLPSDRHYGNAQPSILPDGEPGAGLPLDGSLSEIVSDMLNETLRPIEQRAQITSRGYVGHTAEAIGANDNGSASRIVPLRRELRSIGMNCVAPALPDDDLGCRGCAGAHDRGDGRVIAPDCGLLHRTARERPLDAPCLLCLMSVCSRGGLVPSMCEGAFR